jgi:hypothetical protein
MSDAAALEQCPRMYDGIKPMCIKAGSRMFTDPFNAIEEFMRNSVATGWKFNAGLVYLSLESSEIKADLRYFRCLDNGRGMSYDTMLNKFMAYRGGGSIGDRTLVNAALWVSAFAIVSLSAVCILKGRVLSFAR